MSSNSGDNNDSPSATESEEDLRRRYESKNLSGQKLYCDEVIDISSSASEQAIAPNEQIINTSTQEISSESSDDTMPIAPGDTEGSSSGNEDKHNICQTLDLNQTQATPDLFGSDADTEMPPKLTRGFAGIYHKPFISSPEDASISC